MQKAVRAFVGRLPGRVSTLLSLAQAGELDELRRLAHQLKGAASGFGFPAITETASRVEGSIKASQQIGAIGIAVNELVELMRSVNGYDRTAEVAHVATEDSHR
jgi:HPt (histidine-containing phosphotransfer) domain-containing protein